jgi:hypothetical protein
MLLLIVLFLLFILFISNDRECFACGCSSPKEQFGWSCTFTPSQYPKVDMGTVRDKMANDEYMAWINGARYYS